MAQKRSGLGKGLGALIPSSEDTFRPTTVDGKTPGVAQIPIHAIQANPSPEAASTTP